MFFKHTLQLSDSDIFYSVKANNNPEIIDELKILGSGFEIASLYELQLILNQDIEPGTIFFSNPVKIPKHISIAYKLGINKFAFDTESELIKITNNAPKSNVFLRIEIDNTGAEWSLENKFGAKKEHAVDLFKFAESLNLTPVGISIHNGWNNSNTDTWKHNIKNCIDIIKNCTNNSINLKFLNLGGGFPAHNADQYLFLEKLAIELSPLFSELKKKHDIRIIAEPGTFLVNNTGALIVKIFDIIERNNKKWIFIDNGIMQGFPWVLSKIRYEIHYPYKTEKNIKNYNYIIAGPTNDSKDIFGEFVLPENIKINDFLIIYPAGAYTNSSVCYNGYRIPEIKFAKY